MALASCFTNARLNVERDLGGQNLQSVVDLVHRRPSINAPRHLLRLFQFNFHNNSIFLSRILVSTMQARHVKYILDPLSTSE